MSFYQLESIREACDMLTELVESTDEFWYYSFEVTLDSAADILSKVEQTRDLSVKLLRILDTIDAHLDDDAVEDVKRQIQSVIDDAQIEAQSMIGA